MPDRWARDAARVPFAWFAGDSVYGADSAILRWAERRRRGTLLAVTSGQRLGQRPVTAWIAGLPETAWQRLSAGEGAKGPRLYDWAHLPFNGAAEGFACALLVRVACTRWSGESLFKQAKGAVGLDQYEGRSWVGWHRHVTLSMLEY